MRATLTDIAKKVGVNVSTVCRALQGSSSISKQTRERILQAAESLDYRHNAVARSLVTKRTETFGLVIPDLKCLEHSMFSLMLEGISDEVKALGYSLLFSVADSGSCGSADSIAELEERRVDGYILAWFKEEYIDEKQLIKLANKGHRFVVIGDRHVSSPKVNLVASDNFLGAYKATGHLIKLGHTKIATISGPESHPIVINRFNGFKAALENFGVPYFDEYHRCWHRSVDFRQAGGGEAAMNSMLDSDRGFTALFAFSDMFAAEAMGAIQRRGLKVPNDIAIVGFDGAEYGRFLSPALTTVKQPYYEIGKEAVRMLKLLVEEKEVADNHLWLEPELILRQSCGASKEAKKVDG